jgi:hypothetical protein
MSMEYGLNCYEIAICTLRRLDDTTRDISEDALSGIRQVYLILSTHHSFGANISALWAFH